MFPTEAGEEQLILFFLGSAHGMETISALVYSRNGDGGLPDQQQAALETG
jgi:hypothetical protein